MKTLRLKIIASSFLAISIFSLTLKAEEELRDPFVSILDLKKGKVPLKKIDLSKVILKGIIWNKKRPIAIINDELVAAGEKWQNFYVVNIEKDGVVLTDGEDYYKIMLEETLQLKKEEANLQRLDSWKEHYNLNPPIEDFSYLGGIRDE